MKPFRSRVTIIWVDRRRADAEVVLDVGFGGWTSEHVGVGMDESQVITLLLGEARA